MNAAQLQIKRWREDANTFAEYVGLIPDAWQRKFFRALSSREKVTMRIALKACKGPGKTAVLAIAIWWFMVCWAERGEHPKGAATSITGDNLKSNLWPELAKWMNRSEFLKVAFEWTATRIRSREHPETWFFDARTWPKSADPAAQADTLAGLHAKFLMFVLDESGGIPAAVMATAEAGLANEHLGWAKILQAGNPTHLEGPLYDASVTHRHLWTVYEITADPDDPDRTPRISVEWARQQIEMYGRDNPWVLVNVFGQFPPSSLNSLIGPEEVRAAMKRHSHLKRVEYAHMQKRLGVDVARFGDDRTVLVPRQGLIMHKPIIMRGVRTTDIAARVMLAKRNWDTDVELVDDTGHWGHGVIDNLLVAGHSPVAIQFHAPAIDPRYANRRAEGWLEMVDWIKRGGALYNIPELVAELTTPTYTFKGGKMILEDKDQVKDRLGRSPDIADALALTFMLPDAPKDIWTREHTILERLAEQGAGGRMLSDWDPLEEV